MIDRQTIQEYIPNSVVGAIVVAVIINVVGLTLIFTNYDQTSIVRGDGLGYFELAENLHQQTGFGLIRNGEYVPETFRTPGLPFLYSIFLRLGLGIPEYIVAISLVSAIAIPLLSFFIASQLFDRRTGIVTAWLLCIEPLIVLSNWVFLTEIPFLIFLLTGLSLLLWAAEREQVFSIPTFLAGLSLGASVYIRPAVFPILLLCLGIVLIDQYLAGKRHVVGAILFVLLVTFGSLAPWYVRTHEVTGVYALSGTGWRNVYTDYLASLRAINNNTSFDTEKEDLKQYAMSEWGLTRYEINDPQKAPLMRAYALEEIFGNIDTVIKLQSILFVSYFTHTGYLWKAQRLGVIAPSEPSSGQVSASRLLLDKGVYALKPIYNKMKQQYFTPILERAWSGLVFLGAAVGFFVTKGRARFLLLFIVATGYLTSSAIGLGVESRLRVPILPFYFMLTACGLLWFYSFFTSKVALWKK